MLHVLFIKAECLGESQRMFSAVCSAHDVEGADRSPYRLLILYGASYSERDYLEGKVDSGVPQYTIGYSSSTSLCRADYFRSP